MEVRLDYKQINTDGYEDYMTGMQLLHIIIIRKHLRLDFFVSASFLPSWIFFVPISLNLGQIFAKMRTSQKAFFCNSLYVFITSYNPNSYLLLLECFIFLIWAKKDCGYWFTAPG